MMEWGPAVAIILFILANLVAFFRWVSKLSESFTALAIKFEERTGMILTDVRKINTTLETLANVKADLYRLNEQSKDHELRIRELEKFRGHV